MQDSLLAKEESVENVQSLRLQLEQCQQELLETQKRQEQLEDIFANVADAIIASDTEGLIVEVNRAACELLGYTKEELLLMHPWDFVTSATREEILALIQNAEQGVCMTVPRTYRSKNGIQRQMDLRMTRCVMAERELIVVSCRDVTEQKQLENRLRQSERNLAEGQRLTKTGSWILDFETGNTDWSVETCRIFGFPDPPPSPHYNEFRARVSEEDRDAVDRGLRESFETGEPRPLKYVFVLPDGIRKNIETISQPVRDETGKLKLMGTVMDVTERVNAEEALRMGEDHLRLVIDTIPGLVWSSQPDGNIEYLNKRWIDYTGLTLEEAGGWGWLVAIHPEDRQPLQEYWKSILTAGVAGEFEARLRGHDGTFLWFLFRGVPLYDASGNLVKWYGTNTDIDDRKRTQALLAGENRILEMIASGLPLTPILEALCKFGEASCAGTLVSILLVSPDGTKLKHGAAPSLPQSYTQAIDGGLIGPSAASCGTAAYRKEKVIVSDIATDPLWADYRELALAHELHACWSMPILSSERKVLGTFAIYWPVPCSPSAQHQIIIEQITHLAAVALERDCAENALRRSEAYLSEAQRLTQMGSFSWEVASGKLEWSEEMYRIFGYDKSIQPTLEQALTRIHPEDALLTGSTIEALSREGQDMDFEHRLLMNDGSIKHIHVVARAAGYQTENFHYVGGLIDITDWNQTTKKLQVSEHLALGQLNALKKTLDALSKESDPNKFLEHVLCTIIEELAAHSISVWEMNPALGHTELVASYEDAQLHLPTKSPHSSQRTPSPPNDHPIWTEFFRDGKHCVVGMLDEDPPKIRFEDGLDTTCHDWYGDLVSDPLTAATIKRLKELGIVTTLCVPLMLAGKVTGLLSIRFQQKRTFRSEEIELTRALTHQAMLAVQWMRLSQQSRQAAVMAERNRMARDIHDTLAQGFTGVIVQLEAAEDAISQGQSKNLDHHIQSARELARNSLKEARLSVQALRPSALEDRNLAEALELLSEKMTFGSPLVASFILKGKPEPLPVEWEENLLRIGQEALTNALRHAQAKKFVTRLTFGSDHISLELWDDGRGFDPTSKSDGFGLLGIRERAEGMGGQLVLNSSIGSGTVILIILPIGSTSSSL